MLGNIIGQGENPSNNEASDALQTLNEIIDKWNTESLMIPCVRNITVPLTGQQRYTIGPSGNVVTDRPTNGLYYAYLVVNNMTFPVEIITQVQYDDIVLKQLRSEYVQYIYYNGTIPNGELFVNPIGSIGNLILSTKENLQVIVDLDEEISLPPGYIKAMRYALCTELCVEYGKPVAQQLLEIAVGSKNTIKANNSMQQQAILQADPYLRSKRGYFNIFTGR